jgi:hypothetical protein
MGALVNRRVAWRPDTVLFVKSLSVLREGAVKMVPVHTGVSVGAVAPVRGSPLIRSAGTLWSRGVIVLLTGVVLAGAASVGAAVFTTGALYHVYFDRGNLPDLGPFTRFELPTIGHVYDTNGRPLIELAREYPVISKYEDIPPIVRDAILAAEDKRFFSHKRKPAGEWRSRCFRN